MKSYFKIFIIGLKFLIKKIVDENHICAASFIILFSLWVPYKIMQSKDLKRHTAYAVGIIYKNVIGGKNPKKCYEFYVGDTVYKGTIGYGGLSRIEEGDSIFVAYDSTNPDNSQILGYYEYTLDRSKLPDTVYHRQLIDKMRKPIINKE